MRFSGGAACLGLVALGCAGAAAPTAARPAPPPIVAGSTSAALPDGGEPEPPSAVAVELGISLAWDAWRGGDRAAALALFRKSVAALEALPRALNPKRAQWKREAGVARASVTGADGAWRAVATDKALFFVDGRGAPAGYAAGVVATHPRFIPGTSLVIADDRSATLYDASTAKPVLSTRAMGSPQLSGHGLVAFLTDTSETEPAALHVWSASTRTDRRFPLARKELATFEPVRFAPDEGAVAALVQGDGTPDVYAIFDLATGKRVDVDHAPMTSPPDFSPDGKLLATALPNLGDHGLAGTTVLVDRSTGRRVASSGACSYPTTAKFSRSGKVLLVGDLRRVCVLEVPSLRLLARSAEIRPIAGHDDDLQSLAVLQIVGNDAGFVAGTGDGAMGLFRLPGAALVWKGRGSLTLGKDHRHYIYDEGGAPRELLGFDDTLAVSRRSVSDAEAESGGPPELGNTLGPPGGAGAERALESTLCSVGPWVFPEEACVR